MKFYFYIKGTPQPPAAPILISASATKLEIGWKNCAGAENYDVEVYVNDGKALYRKEKNISILSHSVQNLLANIFFLLIYFLLR